MSNHAMEPTFLIDLFTACAPTLTHLSICLYRHNATALTVAFPVVAPTLSHLDLDLFATEGDHMRFTGLVRACAQLECLGIRGVSIDDVEGLLDSLPDGGRRVEALELDWYAVAYGAARAGALLDKPGFGGIRTLRLTGARYTNAQGRVKLFREACVQRRVVLVEY